MAVIPTKVQQRLVAGIKKLQPILNGAKIKDVNESSQIFYVKFLGMTNTRRLLPSLLSRKLKRWPRRTSQREKIRSIKLNTAYIDRIIEAGIQPRAIQ